MSHHCGRYERFTNRRDFLKKAGAGFGLLALADLLQGEGLLAANNGPSQPLDPMTPRAPHYPARAKSIIWLFMEGAPSSVDLFDPKPELTKRDGQRIDIDVFNGNPGPLMKSPFSFQQYGQSGAWITYGLGSESRNLPGYVVLGNSQGVKGGPLNWSAGFLPTSYQGTLFRSSGAPILNLTRPEHVTRDDQRAQLDFLKQINTDHLKGHAGEPDLLARIQSFELAYRMQMEASDLTDFSNESKETLELYGLEKDASKNIGTKCLMARRLIERGVRFVQVYSDGEWDAHADLKGNHSHHCASTDMPIHGLLTDLKRRGLWDSTLVIWGGEFGRMPVSQGNGGRDHNPNGFMAWMAGAGIQGGVSYGETDEIGYKAVKDRVSVHDLHATMLHLLGMDHEKLTYFHNGRRYRLTDVAGQVIEKLLA